MAALTLKLHDHLAQQIKTLAAQQQISLSDFARNALENYAQQVQQELQLQNMIQTAQSMQQDPAIAKELANLTQELDIGFADLKPSTAEEQTGWCMA